MRLIINRFLPLILISGVLLSVVAGCKKSSNTSSNGTMTASINDTTWTANYSVAGLYTLAANEIEIVGSQIKSGDSTLFYVTFSTPVMAGKTISSDSGLVDIEFANSKGGALYDGGALAGHSILTVTDWDSIHLKIGGSFSGVLYNVTTGRDSVTVTGGTFLSTFALN